MSRQREEGLGANTLTATSASLNIVYMRMYLLHSSHLEVGSRSFVFWPLHRQALFLIFRDGTFVSTKNLHLQQLVFSLKSKKENNCACINFLPLNSYTSRRYFSHLLIQVYGWR